MTNISNEHRKPFIIIDMRFHINITTKLAGCAVAILALTSCSEGKSYSELLNDENKATNYYLSTCRVVNELPEDNKFETGPDAPYYRMDADGNIYMQVVDPGTPDDRVEYDQQIYFRFTRYNLKLFMISGFPTLQDAIDDGSVVAEGNANNLSYGATWFRYDNYQLSASSQYGSAIQLPLGYLGIDCEVNIVVKSQMGFTSEMANVIPYLYNVRYFPAVSN